LASDALQPGLAAGQEQPGWGRARLLAAPEVQAYELDDELVLYDERDGRSFVLNRTGATIWRLCDGRLSVDQIAATIGLQYQLDPEQARADVEPLVSSLRASGLITLLA
jgi:PqqD family protein of HPr-rel-A system